MKNPTTRARSGSPVTIVPSRRGRSRRVQPTSWAPIIAAVRRAVESNPNSAQPAQSIVLSSREGVGFGFERVQYVAERLMKGRDALLFEGEPDVVHVDADGVQPSHRCSCVRDLHVDRASEVTMVLERSNRRFGKRVDRARTDQAV